MTRLGGVCLNGVVNTAHTPGRGRGLDVKRGRERWDGTGPEEHGGSPGRWGGQLKGAPGYGQRTVGLGRDGFDQLATYLVTRPCSCGDVSAWRWGRGSFRHEGNRHQTCSGRPPDHVVSKTTSPLHGTRRRCGKGDDDVCDGRAAAQ